MDISDDSMALGKSYSRIRSRGEYDDGTVLTRHGIVEVYAQGDSESVKHTRLDFVWKGRLYMRNFSGVRYSRRGMVTKANEFAEQVANTLTR